VQKTFSLVPAINLAHRKRGLVDLILSWALTAGRLIIILTEGLALSAFLYRFTLDRQIIDLHGKINQEDAVVKLLNHNEDTYRNLQSRLSLIEKINNQTSQTQKTFFDIFNLTPPDVKITSVSLSKDLIKTVIEARSVNSLALFLKNMKNYPNIKDVSIDTIENRISSANIVVSISAKLKK